MIGPDGRQSVATSGTADLKTGRPVSPDGYFRMASTSKTRPAGRVPRPPCPGRTPAPTSSSAPVPAWTSPNRSRWTTGTSAGSRPHGTRTSFSVHCSRAACCRNGRWPK
ncbi:hypothetical protein QEZ40_002117 [Streptomyces katrae]|uniref:Penicillin-binding protein transpeptidase domain-containing protein n=1 Tax=Streptomyces katrae TaxID=68223 RepID=A0ABT7GVJ3_9ACTN|nr:hypothetical protein [Streptomyces katrae]MDK9497458.1 hypothetical protein [Streptomyces katrae]